MFEQRIRQLEAENDSLARELSDCKWQKSQVDVQLAQRTEQLLELRVLLGKVYNALHWENPEAAELNFLNALDRLNITHR